MKRVMKWLLIFVCCLIVLLIAALFIVPKFIDIRKYRPQIENAVSNATGRAFTLGENFEVSLFPWAAVVVNNVRLENPPGFEAKDMVNVDSFEVRIKFMPLILSFFKEIQVRRFILNGATITLEKTADGRANWEGLGSSSKKPAFKPEDDKKKPGENTSGADFYIPAISVEEFAIRDSSFVWIDHETDRRYEISNLNLELRDVTPDHPVAFVFSAQVEGYPIRLDGNVGPLGHAIGKGAIPLELSAKALDQLNVNLKGTLTDVASHPGFEFSVDVPLFSLRALMAAADSNLSISTAEPEAMTRVAFKADFKGEPGNVKISNGVLNIDGSKLDFSCTIKNFSRPDVAFDLALDEIDLDQYLPLENGNKADKKPDEVTTKKAPPGKKKTDFSPLKRLVLDGNIRIGKLKVADARIQSIHAMVTGKNGIFKLSSLNMNLYGGSLTGNGFLNVKQDTPVCGITIKSKEIRSNPLLKDILEKDILEGRLETGLTLKTQGTDAGRIKRNMNGNGELFVRDGAVKGIDLVTMVRNTDGAYGFARRQEENPRTKFTEFQVPFTIENGVLDIRNTRMTSTLLRVQAVGKADLVKETLKLRIEPTFVTTRKEDVEKMKRSEVMVPVLVTGSFSSPEFRPDLKGVVRKKLEEKVFESEKFKEIFEKEELKPFEKDVKKLLEGILDIPLSEDGQ